MEPSATCTKDVSGGCSRVCTISVSVGRGVAEFVQLVLVGGV